MTQGMAASETHRSGATSLRRSLVDLEHPTTLARRFQRDRLITQTLGGPLPQEFDISGIEQVLDIGCGPGCWALEVADAYRHMQLLGIDVSHTMIEYARSLVAALQLGNVRFLH